MPSPRSGVDWPRLTPHSAGTISPRFSPQSLDLGIFCLGSVLPLRCAAFMGPSMSARRPPADKAVMLIGQQRCVNGDRPITTDMAAAPEWWLLIASTAAETTTSCTLAARHPLRTWLLGCWISPSRPLDPPKTALIPARQSSPRHRVVCSDERTQLRLDKEKKPRWREEASGVVSQHLGLPNIGRGTPPPRAGVWSPVPLLLPVPGHHRPLPAAPQLHLVSEPQNRMRGGVLGVLDAANAEASIPNAGRCHQRDGWRH